MARYVRENCWSPLYIRQSPCMYVTGGFYYYFFSTGFTSKFSNTTGKLFLPGAAATTPICAFTPGGKYASRNISYFTPSKEYFISTKSPFLNNLSQTDSGLS